MYEFSSKETKPSDALFMERLEAFLAKCLAEMKAFSERELRPFEETRQYVAEWHNKYLFQSCVTTAVEAGPAGSITERSAKARSILCEASRILETLYESAGVQSFLVAVDPLNPSDEGFLGGSEAGREFWRGFRGGGSAGVKALKTQCLRNVKATPPNSLKNATPVPVPSSVSSISPPSAVPSAVVPSLQPPAKPATAKATKTELYDAIRKALRYVNHVKQCDALPDLIHRTTSGVRNAEMKWTNPERLDIYGVRLIGWPDDIPKANPSTLKQSQNRRLLDLAESHQLRFEPLGGNAEVVIVEKERGGSQEPQAPPPSSQTSQATQEGAPDGAAEQPLTDSILERPPPVEPVNQVPAQIEPVLIATEFDDLSWAYDFERGALPTHNDDQGRESPVIRSAQIPLAETAMVVDQQLSVECTTTVGRKRRRSDFDTESSDSEEERSSSSFSS
ncbi:hypothetical protein AX16_002644 [Volvariella volvacea WC 439]|nr:hypothetical protein AX16_002644 [Volvariella volvacea WC 439]